MSVIYISNIMSSQLVISFSSAYQSDTYNFNLSFIIIINMTSPFTADSQPPDTASYLNKIRKHYCTLSFCHSIFYKKAPCNRSTQQTIERRTTGLKYVRMKSLSKYHHHQFCIRIANSLKAEPNIKTFKINFKA